MKRTEFNIPILHFVFLNVFYTCILVCVKYYLSAVGAVI